MKRYWFVDTVLTAATDGAEALPGRLEKRHGGPLFSDDDGACPDRPWEGRMGNGYPNVLYDRRAGLFRCYYTAYLNGDAGGQAYRTGQGRTTGILYAESADGLVWKKPSLGAVEYMGSVRNNIVALHTHGAGVFLDEAEEDPRRRYKLLSRDDRGPLRIQAAFSEDGVRFGGWQPVIDSPALPGDTHNFALRDGASGRFVLYTRCHRRELRAEARLVSDDFLHWRDPQTVLTGLGPDDQIYGMTVFPQDGLLWGLADIYHGGDSALPCHDHVDVELCVSGDGVSWRRVAPGVPCIPNGPEGAIDWGCCFASPPVRRSDELWLYYAGNRGTHYHIGEGGLCLGTVDARRLAGMRARNGRAFALRTRLLSGGAEPLLLCADVLPGGSIRCEALDREGAPLPGLSLAESAPLTASGSALPLRWRSGAALPEVFSLRLVCEGAALYTLGGELGLLPARPLGGF